MTDRRSQSLVTNYAGPRAFYTKDMARKHRAAQDTPLPPRCVHCRLPGNAPLNGIPHCSNHTLGCDGTCGWNDAPVIISPPSPWHGEGTTQPVAQVEGGPMAFRGKVTRAIPTQLADGRAIDSETEERYCEHAHRKQEPARRCGERMAESLNGRLT